MKPTKRSQMHIAPSSTFDGVCSVLVPTSVMMKTLLPIIASIAGMTSIVTIAIRLALIMGVISMLWDQQSVLFQIAVLISKQRQLVLMFNFLDRISMQFESEQIIFLVLLSFLRKKC